MPVPEKKEKRMWDGVDSSDRTQGKCKTCGISPENISRSTGNCYNCDDKQPQLFDYQLSPTQIHGSVHSSLLQVEVLPERHLASKSSHVDLISRSRYCPRPEDRQWDCPLCNTGEPHNHDEEGMPFT